MVILSQKNDFHIIDSNSEISFKQTLSIDTADIENHLRIENIGLKWVYENKISKWEGGIKTLDEPTKKLFAGKEIPYIWQGKIQSTIAIEIIK